MLVAALNTSLRDKNFLIRLFHPRRGVLRKYADEDPVLETVDSAYGVVQITSGSNNNYISLPERTSSDQL